MSTTNLLLAQTIDLKRQISALDKKRERLQSRLWASLESLEQENLKYGTLAEPRSAVLEGVTPHWRKILACFVEHRHFRAKDVIFASRQLHKNQEIPRVQTAGSARFQLAALEKKGVLKRVGGGNYALSGRAKTELDSLTDFSTLPDSSAGDAR